MARVGRAVPHRNADGDIDGYRISAIRSSGVPAAAGFTNGDVLHSVNGVPLTSTQGAMAAYQAIADAETLVFELTRRGERRTLTIKLVEALPSQ